MDKKYIDLDYAKLDIERTKRRGFCETVFCESKTEDQLIGIFKEFKNQGQNILGTSASFNQAKAVKKVIEGVLYDECSRTLTLVQKKIEKVGLVAICTGGTGDIPIAKEACITAEFFGSNTANYYDVGIAGIHRLLDKIDEIKKANVIIAIAGFGAGYSANQINRKIEGK